MNKMITIIIFSLAISIIGIFACYPFLQSNLDTNTINTNLEVEGIKFGMSEDDVIRLWGPGDYIYGMGGHGREYKDKRIKVSFPEDSDNDFYREVSSLEFSNPNYSIFSIKVGLDRKIAGEKLRSYQFKPVDNSEGLYVNGEFFISIQGKDNIEHILISFIDKDLRNRNY